jgi:hypothetical protein
VKDNTLIEDPAGGRSNATGPAIYLGRNSGGLVRRALLAFDVAAVLPAGAIVDDVELRLTVSKVPNGNPTTVTVHRVLADWGEGTSWAAGGSGGTVTAGDATWIHTFHPSSFWVAPGGDFDPAVHASLTILGTGAFTWTGPALVTDVQAWLDDPAGNFGWVLRGDEATLQTSRKIDSREAFDPATRPELVIQYRPDPNAIGPASWARTKARYR